MYIVNKDTYLSSMRSRIQDKIAKDIFQKQTIDSIVVTDEGNFYHVYGTTIDQDQKYKSELKISKNLKIIIHHLCNCSDNNNDGCCGHVGAIILYLLTLDIPQLPFYYSTNKHLQEIYSYSEQEKNNLLHAHYEIKKIVENYIQNQYQIKRFNYMHLLFEFHFKENSWFLKFKIGHNKMYQIKNINHFLQCVVQEQTLYLGKFFKYDLYPDIFDEKSKLIYEFLNLQQLNYQSSIVNSMLMLNNDNLEDIFELCEKLELADLFFIPDEKKFYLDIQKTEVGYSLEFKQIKEAVTTTKAIYYLKDNKLHRNALNNNLQALILFKLIHDQVDHKLYVAQQDFNLLEKYNLMFSQNEFLISDIYQSKEYLPQLKIYADINADNKVFISLNEYQNDQIKQGFDLEYLNKSSVLQKTEYFIKKHAKKIDYELHEAYFDIDDYQDLDFINYGIALLQQDHEVYVSDNLSRLGLKRHYKVSVGVKIENDLLNLSLKTDNFMQDELWDILKSYREKKKYYQLKTGELISLHSDDLKEVDQLLEKLNVDLSKQKSANINLDLYRSLNVSSIMNDFTNIEIVRQNSFENLLANFKEVKIDPSYLLKPYHKIMREYQKDGYYWLCLLRKYNFSGILADDMGLGKTLQVIALLDKYRNEGISLVVCPSSLILNWAEEIKKFSKTLKAIPIYGNLNQRKQIIQNANNYHVLITSYDYLKNDLLDYQDLQFNYLILDEAQYIKNKNTKNAISVKKLNSKHRLALTGTPIENSLAELWSIFDFLMPNYLYDYSYFKNNFESLIIKNDDRQAKLNLKKLVKPFILRRHKKEVLKELPNKTEHIIELYFNDLEEKLYQANVLKIKQYLGNKEVTNKIQVLAMLTKLREICLDASLIYQDVNELSSKIKGCLDLIVQLQENKQKVLVFSSFTSVFDILKEQLEMKNISYYTLVGSTSKDKRQELVSSFQNDDTTVFLISLKAGGTGLNLTAASSIIHLDPWWNIAAQNQATDRAYRIGQHNNVQVYKLIMKNTIEEKIMDLQKSKQDIADIFLKDNANNLQQLDQDQLLELFEI